MSSPYCKCGLLREQCTYHAGVEDVSERESDSPLLVDETELGPELWGPPDEEDGDGDGDEDSDGCGWGRL